MRNAFDTQRSEPMVGREACLGRGLHHRDQVQPASAHPFEGQTGLLDVRRGVSRTPDSPGGNATRSAARNSGRAMRVSAQCQAHQALAFLLRNRESLSPGFGVARDADPGDEVVACAQQLQAAERGR